MVKKIFISFFALLYVLIPLNIYSENGKTIVLTINSKTAYVNNNPVSLDVAPMIVKGRTVVPLRFISENFGAKKINFVAKTQEITIELDDPVKLLEENTALIEKNKSLEENNIAFGKEIETLKTEIETLKNRIKELENQKPPESQIQKPNAPENIHGKVTNQQVFINWSPSIQGTNPIEGYMIYRTEDKSSDSSLIGFSPAEQPTFIDQTIKEGSFYVYFLKAFDNGNPSYKSDESARITIQIPIKSEPDEIVPPTAPGFLEGNVSNNQVKLTWIEAKVGSNPIGGYNIYRAEGQSSTFNLINTVKPSSLSYIDDSVLENKSYTYYIKAFDTATPMNESIESNRVEIKVPSTTPPPPPPPPPKDSPPSTPTNLRASVSNNQVNLSWNESKAGSKTIGGYKIYRATDGSTYFSVITTLSASSVSYSDTQVSEGKSYNYYVTAFDTASPANESEKSNQVEVTISFSNDNVTVYITKTGDKYHKDGCRYLEKSKIAITLKEAKANGYTPCGTCKPPTLKLFKFIPQPMHYLLAL